MHCLIKVGKREHIESLSTKGIVFMNSINFFREMEDNEHRKDIYEGIEKIEQITWIKMVLGDKEVEFSKNTEKNRLGSSQLRMSNPKLEGNIYSMIAVTDKLLAKTDRIDERNLGFGDTLLVIYNPKEFMNRINRAINDSGMKHFFGLVQYYSEEVHEGNLGVFDKPQKYEHQNEFRIFVVSNKKAPLVLEIGNIEDISTVKRV